MSHPVVDTRHLFRPLAVELASLLRSLEIADFDRPTVAGSWRVREVVAHIVDIAGRRLSFHRDRMPPPPPDRAITSAQDFLDFINALNARWIEASQRFSPQLLTALADTYSRELADWFEGLPLDAPALFGVSWAGEFESAGWFDVGREFAELWHHQQQIRLAVGAPLQTGALFLTPLLRLAMRALPPALGTAGHVGDRVAVHVTGEAGGDWTATRGDHGWTVAEERAAGATCDVRMSDDTAWRLLFHMMSPAEARARLIITGRQDLAAPLVSARAVIV